MESSLRVFAARAGSTIDSNPKSGDSSFRMASPPRLLVRKINVRSKLTRVLSPSRSMALSRTPSSRRDMLGAAFSISSNSTSERLEDSLVTEPSFCCVNMGCVSR